MFEHLCHINPDCDREVMKSVVTLAVELAREGREGHRVGAVFMVGDEDRVLALSRPLILDPLYGHDPSLRQIHDPNLRETLKELALLDGAFVISAQGLAVSACRYLNASAEGLEISLGLGARHVAASATTRATKAMAVVISESGVVRIFFKGELVAEILPELWLLSREMSHLDGPVEDREYAGVRVFTRRD
ncbi:MAG: diadenylate cyclase [Proteobacteria bacterium]|nr:diadenylate cyclase [Pseudomonadota bacterium]